MSLEREQSAYLGLLERCEVEHGALLGRVEGMDKVYEEEVKDSRRERDASERRASMLVDKLEASEATLFEERERSLLMQKELVRRCAEMQALEERLETLAAFVPARDAAIIFHKGQVRREDFSQLRSQPHKVVVARFAESQKKIKEADRFLLREASKEFSGFDVRRFSREKRTSRKEEEIDGGQENAVATALSTSEKLLRTTTSRRSNDDSDGLAAALAAQGAKFANYRRDTLRQREDREKQLVSRLKEVSSKLMLKENECRDLTQSLVEERRKCIHAEADRERAVANYRAKADDLFDKTANLRAKLEAEAYVARQALAAEIDGATRSLIREKDQALHAKTEAIHDLQKTKRRYADNLALHKQKIATLKASLKKLSKQRNLEVEGFGRDLAALRTKLNSLEPPSQKRAHLAPSSQARRFLGKNRDNEQ